MNVITGRALRRFVMGRLPPLARSVRPTDAGKSGRRRPPCQLPHLPAPEPTISSMKHESGIFPAQSASHRRCERLLHVSVLVAAAYDNAAFSSAPLLNLSASIKSTTSAETPLRLLTSALLYALPESTCDTRAAPPRHIPLAATLLAVRSGERDHLQGCPHITPWSSWEQSLHHCMPHKEYDSRSR